MSEHATTADQPGEDGVRVHPEDPAEGADGGPLGEPGKGEPPVERAHSQDPAEGADDPEMTGG